MPTPERIKRYYNKIVQKNCSECGLLFSQKIALKGICNECIIKRRRIARPKTIHICQNCKKDFFSKGGHLKQKFCSKHCWYSYDNKVSGKLGKHYPHLQRARIGNCRICGKEYRAVNDHKKRKQVYCSKECFQIGWAKFSRPNIVPSNFATGERNKSWKGDFPSYSAMHKWVARYKGNPRKCDVCASEKKRKYEWANIDHSYKRNLDDYIRMCTSCHRRHDIENNGYRVGVI